MAKRKPKPPKATDTEKQNKKKRGRPAFEFNQQLADTMCELIAGGKSLTDVCKLEGMPSRTVAYKWLRKSLEFQHEYARACEDRADLIADEVIAIADSEPDPNKARVRIDARKWWAGKVNPKKYGDRTEITGKDGGAIEIKSDGTDLETARRVAFMLGRAIGKQNTVQITADSYADVTQIEDARE